MRLFLVRNAHAISGEPDELRPLSERGRDEAGDDLGLRAGQLGHRILSVPRAVMCLAYGDEWTNMLQPFWALPLLAITGLKARDILGWSLAIMLLSGPLFALALLVF